MYLMCGAFRLARFNLQATRPRVLQEGTPKIDKKNFVGLPIPPAAGLLASIVHFAPMPLFFVSGGFTTVPEFLVMVLIAVLGILMVSTIRYTSFKTVGTGRRKSLYVPACSGDRYGDLAIFALRSAYYFPLLTFPME
jgi:CDP-diacylglycerol--serine O-phosphatidyltransferase